MVSSIVMMPKCLACYEERMGLNWRSDAESRKLGCNSSFTNKVFKDFSICFYCSLVISYVYYALDSILCLINRSLSYALIGFCLLSVCRYFSSGLSTERSDRIGQGR